MYRVRTRVSLSVFAQTFLWLGPGLVVAGTGTFIDRHAPDDLRVVSYNVLFETIFPAVNPIQATKFGRVVRALDPDGLNLQEIRDHSADDVVGLLNAIAPLDQSETWFAHQGDDNVIASKHPLSMTLTNTNPPKDGTAIALVDLPNEEFDADLYVINNYFTCCNTNVPPGPLDPNEQSRQWEADAIVSWMRDARTPGELVDLPNKTPMLVVGDLNIINIPSVLDPLGTLLTGDIFNERWFGADSAPDWDGTSMADAHPLHNASGPDDYTWRNDISQFAPGRLDYILYTNSVLRTANRFVLNTVDMTSDERLATELSEFDITVDLAGVTYDHLPLVTDFRLIKPGDYNDDGSVDGLDYATWRDHIGTPAGSLANDVDGGVVGAARYQTWKAAFEAVSPPSPLTVPEPATARWFVWTSVVAMFLGAKRG